MVSPDHRTLINSYEFYLQLKTAKPFHLLLGQHPVELIKDSFFNNKQRTWFNQQNENSCSPLASARLRRLKKKKKT